MTPEPTVEDIDAVFNNPKFQAELKDTAAPLAILRILISKGITTTDEYLETVEQALPLLRKITKEHLLNQDPTQANHELNHWLQTGETPTT